MLHHQQPHPVIVQHHHCAIYHVRGSVTQAEYSGPPSLSVAYELAQGLGFCSSESVLLAGAVPGCFDWPA